MSNDLDNQQAATLKEMVRKEAGNTENLPRPRGEANPARRVPRTLAVTSGKGGVGKTLISVNLAMAFARRGQRVLIIDADLGLANIDVVLGLSPQFTIHDVITGAKTLDEVALAGPEGVTVLPAASGVAELAHMTEEQRLVFMDHIDHWNRDFDVVLVDTGAGISENVRYFVLAVERIMVVATSDPASITDAYALMKVMFMNHRIKHFDLLVNQVRSSKEALEVYRAISNVADRFLSITLNYNGFIPQDPHVSRALRQQKPVAAVLPESPVVAALDTLAERLLQTWDSETRDEGRMTFFWRRLLEEEQSGAKE
ncbi:MAG: MinD/ParA family protein [Magnetococcus sp. WYHC-3]